MPLLTIPASSRHRRLRLIAAAACVVVAGAALAACGSSKGSAGTTSTSQPSSSSSPNSSKCTGKPVTAKAKKATMTVTPGTCLHEGSIVRITGTGFAPKALGGLSECNSTNGQPTVSIEGNKVPVGCTNPLTETLSISASGTLQATFKIRTGSVGPPANVTDSAGHKAAADARSYPCPPTSSQASGGATCGISIGDSGGDQVTVPLSFAPGS